MSDINVAGMSMAENVIETIVSIAVTEVEGVASVGMPTQNRFFFSLAPTVPAQGIELSMDENDHLHVAVHIEVFYGYVLPELAENVRAAIVDAVAGQLGAQVGSVDVFIDGIRFDD